MIVEEAAEVLESHIVAALSEGCQQLILIGMLFICPENLFSFEHTEDKFKGGNGWNF